MLLLLWFLLQGQPLVTAHREVQTNWVLDAQGQPDPSTRRQKVYERQWLDGRLYRVLLEKDGRRLSVDEMTWTPETPAAPLPDGERTRVLDQESGGLLPGSRITTRIEDGAVREVIVDFYTRLPDGRVRHGLQVTRYTPARDRITQNRCASSSCSAPSLP